MVQWTSIYSRAVYGGIKEILQFYLATAKKVEYDKTRCKFESHEGGVYETLDESAGFFS